MFKGIFVFGEYMELNIENINNAFKSIDNRPIVIWQGKLNHLHRVILTAKNNFIVEECNHKDALGNEVWSYCDSTKAIELALFQAIHNISLSARTSDKELPIGDLTI
jgi:hypothetical protein